MHAITVCWIKCQHGAGAAASALEALAPVWKLALLAVAAPFAVILTDDRFLNAVIALAAIAALVVYRLRRRFKRGAARGWADVLDRNMVEIILALCAIPNAWKLLPGVARWFNAIP